MRKKDSNNIRFEDGISLNPSRAWHVRGKRKTFDPSRIVLELFNIMPTNTTICFEGGCHSKEIKGFLSENNVTERAIRSGTIWPKQKIIHVTFSFEICGKLGNILDRHAAPELCEHMYVYKDNNVLVEWHDFGDRNIYLSSDIDEEQVITFCEATDCQYERLPVISVPDKDS